MVTGPVYFATPAEFRAWLERHHARAPELIVGYYKVATGRPSMTWPQSVAEALCFGWIDGIRRTVDAESYCVRFTPRRPRSVWSAINIRLVAELEAAGKMTPAGRAAFEARPHKSGPKSRGYRAQKRDGTLDAVTIRAFKKNRRAWAFFEAQPPGYRRTMAWWVMQAKKPETRERRLGALVAASGQGRRLK